MEELTTTQYLLRNGARLYMLKDDIVQERLWRCRQLRIKHSYMDEFWRVWKELGWE